MLDVDLKKLIVDYNSNSFYLKDLEHFSDTLSWFLDQTGSEIHNSLFGNIDLGSTSAIDGYQEYHEVQEFLKKHEQSIGIFNYSSDKDKERVLNGLFCDILKGEKKLLNAFFEYLDSATNHKKPSERKSISVEQEYENIDIFISYETEGRPHCILIESKLNDAGDRPAQIPRYITQLLDDGYEIDYIVYLPLTSRAEPEKTHWKKKDISRFNNYINQNRFVSICAKKLVYEFLEPQLGSITDKKVIGNLENFLRIMVEKLEGEKYMTNAMANRLASQFLPEDPNPEGLFNQESLEAFAKAHELGAIISEEPLRMQIGAIIFRKVNELMGICGFSMTQTDFVEDCYGDKTPCKYRYICVEDNNTMIDVYAYIGSPHNDDTQFAYYVVHENDDGAIENILRSMNLEHQIETEDVAPYSTSRSFFVQELNEFLKELQRVADACKGGLKG